MPCFRRWGRVGSLDILFLSLASLLPLSCIISSPICLPEYDLLRSCVGLQMHLLSAPLSASESCWIEFRALLPEVEVR